MKKKRELQHSHAPVRLSIIKKQRKQKAPFQVGPSVSDDFPALFPQGEEVSVFEFNNQHAAGVNSSKSFHPSQPQRKSLESPSDILTNPTISLKPHQTDKPLLGRSPFLSRRVEVAADQQVSRDISNEP